MGRIRVLDTDPVGFLIGHLAAHLPPDVIVGADRIDDQLPYVTVRNDGGHGNAGWHADSALGINVWAADEHAAQTLALDVRSLVEFATSRTECLQATCSMPIDIADSSRNPRRYLKASLRLSQRLP